MLRRQNKVNAMKNDRIIIFDTTLRDGEQCPGASMNSREKLEVARQLARLKVDVIEAGFPVSSEGDFSSVQTIAREVKGPIIAGLARCVPKDIDAAGAARSEEHTSELQSHHDLVCRLLLEKKKK